MNRNLNANFIDRWARVSPAGFLLHVALLLILAGALITFFTSARGLITVSEDAVASSFAGEEGAVRALPFGLRLQDFKTICHEGTSAPADYVAEIEVTAVSGGPSPARSIRLSMNHVGDVDGYRLCLKSFKGGEVTLGVNHDPAGIAVTYAGYYLLFACSAWLLLRRCFMHPGRRAALTVCAAMTACVSSYAETPGEAFARMRIYWGDRPAAGGTVARDMLARIHGSDSYKGLPPEDVMLGLVFDYDRWIREPLVKIKGDEIRRLLGVSGNYAAYTDFFGPGGYRLEPLLADLANRDAHDADERVRLISAWCDGSLMKVFPYRAANGEWVWLTPVDSKPSKMPLDKWKTVSTSFNEAARHMSLGNPPGAARVFNAIADYQMRELPVLSERELEVEIFYMRGCGTLMPGVIALVAGVALLILARYVRMAWRRPVAVVITALLFAWLCALVALRWYLAGHFPLSNGFETMQGLAWIAAAGGLWAAAATKNVRGAGLCMILTGLALMVCTMGGGNSLSPLMPVLASPLLSVHVLLVMAGYCLAALIFLNSFSALFAGKEASASVARGSMRLLEPAVLLLACGIFVGAIWANMSWGRYWGWDPKETWALITMLIYCVPLHRRWLRPLCNPRILNIYLTLAFLSVLMTYFGVNFFLGGMHSYA